MKQQTDPYGKAMKKYTKKQNKKIYTVKSVLSGHRIQRTLY